MAIIISPAVARLQSITTGLDPVSYPALDSVWGLHGVEYPNGGVSTVEPPSLDNANRVYDTETFTSTRRLGILLPISFAGVPTVPPGRKGMPQYRRPRWPQY